MFSPEIPDGFFSAAEQFRNIGIGKTHSLGFNQRIPVQMLQTAKIFDPLFIIHDVPDFVKEKHVDSGTGIDCLKVRTKPQKLRNRINPVIGSVFNIGHQFLDGLFFIVRSRFIRKIPDIEFRKMNMVFSVLQGADSFQQAFFHGPADAHSLAGGLHLCGKHIGCLCKLVKRKARHFGHNIVQSGFKAGRGIGKRDFIQIHPYGNFRRDTGNRVSACFRGQCR